MMHIVFKKCLYQIIYCACIDYYHCQKKRYYILYIVYKELVKLKNRVKVLRAEFGYNQTQLAELAGISRQTISLIERNNYIPSILTALKIARIFDKPVENIFILDK